MSASNGDRVIKIGRHGVFTFEFEGLVDGKVETVPVELDVVEVDNAWHLEARKFLDKDGKLIPEKTGELQEARVQFVRDIVAGKYDTPNTNGNLTEEQKEATREKYAKIAESLRSGAVLAFHAHVQREVKKVVDFFYPPAENEQSPPASSGADVIFSE